MTYAYTHLRGTIDQGPFQCSYCAYIQVSRSGGEEPVFKLFEVESVIARVDVLDPDTGDLIGFYPVESAPFAAQRYWLMAIHKAIDADFETMDVSELNFIPAS